MRIAGALLLLATTPAFAQDPAPLKIPPVKYPT